MLTRITERFVQRDQSLSFAGRLLIQRKMLTLVMMVMTVISNTAEAKFGVENIHDKCCGMPSLESLKP